VAGAFITFEGIEGVGKTTSLDAAANYLARRGMRVRVTREPGGTRFGERLRELLLHGEHGEPIVPKAEALLMFAARAQHLEAVIRPALERGEWVLCDRFTDATIAYQGGGRGVERSFLERLRVEVQGSLGPHLTLLLDAPVEVGRSRIAGRAHDHFEREQSEFFERVRRSYLQLADEEPARIERIDAAQPIEAVTQQLEAALGRFVARWEGR
jgi:dTMP kinase